MGKTNQPLNQQFASVMTEFSIYGAGVVMLTWRYKIREHPDDFIDEAERWMQDKNITIIRKG